MMLLICRILKSGINECVFKTGTVTDAENKHDHQGRKEGRMNQETGIDYTHE